MPRELGKKGSRHKLHLNKKEVQAFEEIKKKLCLKLILQRMNPDRFFNLRVDASRFAVGGTLEQLVDEDRKPTAEYALNKKLSL